MCKYEHVSRMCLCFILRQNTMTSGPTVPSLREQRRRVWLVNCSVLRRLSSEDRTWHCNCDHPSVPFLTCTRWQFPRVRPLIPPMPRVFSGYCLIQTEFHQLSLWISGFRTGSEAGQVFLGHSELTIIVRPIPSHTQKQIRLPITDI